ncbi:hypothetical protein FD754_017528 [Muntiacus muntjak]|uniref:Uncharacterized protein n=1 Tax=Muntiacus muntjak TaxID=9888 RepID=A0A5N3VTU3_MUNMU|nr:hypothetical protein FD754_017528 [Muntiacus muntjak]
MILSNCENYAFFLYWFLLRVVRKNLFHAVLLEEVATPSSILAWEIPWTEEPGKLQFPGEGNGNPLQYSCLENPMDREAWRATVHGVARVGHNLATKPPAELCYNQKSIFL